MKRFISNKKIVYILGIVLIFVLWGLLSIIIGEDTFIFPGPIKTIKQAFSMLKESYIYKCIWQTIIRMLGGFIISFVLAFILGTIAGNNENIEELLKPSITLFKSVPTASLVYLFLVLVGARMTPMVIVIMVSFPILYESIVGGIKATPIAYIEAARLDATTKINENLKVRIPLAIPYVMVGVASSFALSLKIEIMAEVITGYTRLGLGSAILAAQRSDPTNMVPVFAYSLVAIVIMLVFDGISNMIKNKYGK